MTKAATRAEAGAQYAAAAQAYLEAWVELHAHDHAANSDLGFRAAPPAAMPHPEFLPHAGAIVGFAIQAAQRRAHEISQVSDAGSDPRSA